MRFVLGKQDMTGFERAQERCWLLANGLGGSMSGSAAFSVTRCDQSLLMAAAAAPNKRVNLVQRLSEALTVGEKRVFLSSQGFADQEPEDGYKYLSSFIWDNGPAWMYHFSGVQVRRECGMAYGKNASAVVYTVESRAPFACTLQVRPFCLFAPKGEAVLTKNPPVWSGGVLASNGYRLYIHTDGTLTHVPPEWERPVYPDDTKDGRTAESLAVSCCVIECTVLPGETATLQIVFSDTATGLSGKSILTEQRRRYQELEERSGFRDPAARQLAVSADAFIARRDSTNGKTILAGYPFFGDWGRDTMIALPGCLLATGRFEEAKSVLTTFLEYEKEGLMPNLFPEGQEAPRYNTADAALLFINCVWLYYQKTLDIAFVKKAWPKLTHIADCNLRGNSNAIKTDHA
ncbi:MAG: amylo-alpha-1,6-glucosidase [Oscillospiraceae bacterium]|nr:amylo-alpha-1,6-glucosidase [Oscillospiraceae bacterium]